MVTTKNVVHAALYLVVVLAGVAAQYILLAAEFVAVVQVLVYIGAIVVLFLFGIMLTRAPIGRTPTSTTTSAGRGGRGRCSSSACSSSVSSTASAATKHRPGAGRSANDRGRRRLHLPGLRRPFEVVSVLLLAALVGAIVLARRD